MAYVFAIDRFLVLVGSAAALSSCALTDLPPDVRGPRVAHHQHLVSPDFAPLVKQEQIDAAALLKMMDEAGAERAVVLSVGYSFADERKRLTEPEDRVRAENDWTAAQVATSPKRLRGFCAVNPLTPGALTEIERCNRLPGMRGVKLHFGNSGVSLRNPVHAARAREVFGLANRLRVPIVVHLRSRSGTPYGAEDARLFIDELLPAAPAITVQVAHLAGSGPGHPADADAALAVFAEAIAVRDERTRRLVFDLTTVVANDASVEDGILIARRLRQVGVERVYFGSDLPIGGNPPLAASWRLFRQKVPMTAAEFAQIAANVAPYLRTADGDAHIP